MYFISPNITILFGFTTVTEGNVPKAPVWLAVTTATLLKGIISVEADTKAHAVPVTVDVSTWLAVPVAPVLSAKVPVTDMLPAIVSQSSILLCT